MNDYDGTSINELQNRSTNQQMSQQQYEQHQKQYQQQLYQQQQEEIDNQKEHFDIDELAKDISDNLNDKEPFETDSEEKDDENFTLSIPNNFKDPLLLLTVFVILSQSSVRQLFGKYIPYINPDEEGVVSIIGIVIYGIILVAIYMLIKKLL